MTSHRTLHWSVAVHGMKADRAPQQPVREERLRSAVTIADLTAWRGYSGRRYVCSVYPASAAGEFQGDAAALVLAVARNAAGIAALLAIGSVPAGTTELHIHRLAESADDRAAAVADLEPGSAHHVIARMLALLGDPARWCRGVGARDAAGLPCSPTSPEAVAWSLEGAIDRAADRDTVIGDLVEDRLCALLPDMAGPAAFNDYVGTTHEDVVALLRQLLAAA